MPEPSADGERAGELDLLTRAVVHGTEEDLQAWALTGPKGSAIGLKRASAVADDALADLIADPEYLVRYHALESLAAIGSETALPALEGFVGRSAVERELAERAIAAITRRARTNDSG